MEESRLCVQCGEVLVDGTLGTLCWRCKLEDVREILEAEETLPGHAFGASGEGPDGRKATPELPGKYTGLREFARGGMGRVLIAHDEHLGRDIIIKELLGDVAGETGAGGTERPLRESTPLAFRFVREARIAGQLEHPGIVPVHELGCRANGDLYYTMKYVRGKSMSEAIREADGLAGRLGLLPHVLGACQAIAYAHSRGVIHRDIKPANIMVGEFGETVVLDWGLARVKNAPDEVEGAASGAAQGPPDPGGGGEETAAGQILGTPAYMSPEQARGRSADLDERTDVYALGALLYTVLTGAAPFSGGSREALLRQVLSSAPRPIRECVPALAPELAAICEKAMDRYPGRRYATARELAEELQRFLNGGLVSAYSYGAAEHLRRFIRRNRRAVATAAVAFILLNAVAIYSYLHILDERNRAVEARDDANLARSESETARQQAEEREAEGRQELYARQIALADVALNSDPTRLRPLLRECPPEFRNWEWYWLWNMSDTSKNTLQVSEDQIPATIQSSNPAEVLDAVQGFRTRLGCGAITEIDSKGLVLSRDDQGRLVLWDIRRGKPLAALQVGSGPIRNLAVDPRGRYAAMGLVDFGLECWDLRNNTLLWSQQDPQTFSCTFSPDGETLAVGMPGPTRLYVTVTGAVRGEPATNSAYAMEFSPDGRYLACGEGGTVRLVDVGSAEIVRSYIGHEENVVAMAFSPDGRQLLTGSKDTTVRLWDVDTGIERQTLRGSQQPILGVAFHPNGRTVCAAGKDGAVRLWDVQSGELLAALLGHDRAVNSVAFSADGKEIVAMASGTLKVWEIESPVAERKLMPGEVMTQVAFHPNGKLLSVARQYQSTLFFNRETGQPYPVAPVFQAFARHAVFSPDGRVLLMSEPLNRGATPWRFGEWVSLVVRKFPEGTELWRTTAATGYDAIAFSTKGGLLAHLDVDGRTIHLRDAATGEARLTLHGHVQPLLTLALNPDGTRLASAGDDYVVKVWDTRTGENTITYRGHNNRISKVCFSPDGSFVASAGRDGTVQIWNPETGQPMTPPSQVPGTARMAISPDGSRLVTGDNILHLLDARTGRLLLSFGTRRPLGLRSVVFSPDGRTIASVFDYVYLREASTPEEVEAEWGKDTAPLLAQAPNLENLAPKESCHDLMLRIDGALLAWANANGKALGEAPPPLADLHPVTGEPPLPEKCPSGGEYVLASLGDFSTCTIHGKLEIPVMMLPWEFEAAANSGDERALEIARARFTAALSADGDLLYEYAWTLITSRVPLPEVALIAARKAVDLEPDNLVRWRLLGRVELKAGEVEAAVTHFRKGFEANHTASAVGLALALLTRGQESDIAEAYELLAAPPDWENTHYTPDLIEVLQKVPPPGEQLKPLIDARLKKHHDLVRAQELNGTAWSLLTSTERDPARALELAMEAVALSERRNAMILDTLAKALAENGRLEEAIRTQQEALEKLPDPASRSDYQTRLREYERARALQKIDAAP